MFSHWVILPGKEVTATWWRAVYDLRYPHALLEQCPQEAPVLMALSGSAATLRQIDPSSCRSTPVPLHPEWRASRPAHLSPLHSKPWACPAQSVALMSSSVYQHRDHCQGAHGRLTHQVLVWHVNLEFEAGVAAAGVKLCVLKSYEIPCSRRLGIRQRT